MTEIEEITTLLQVFQAGYTHRDIDQLDTFMELFSQFAEVIGTNGIEAGREEWYTSRDAARAMVLGDWQNWGSLRLDLDCASINICGEVGWIAASATVTQRIGEENYSDFLEYIKEFIETSTMPPEQKLHYILRGGMNTVYELHQGERFIWPLRFTAVVVHEPDGWKFAQVHFSYPTIYFPDVRTAETLPS